MDFIGKTAIVTGGTRGIGKAIAELIQQLGGHVIVTGTSEKSRDSFDRKRCTYIQLDLSNQESIGAFLEKVKKIKNIDVLVNNAGINKIEPIDEIDVESWNKIIKVNLTGPMLVTRTVAALMKKRKTGRILNISSIWAVIGKEKRNSYSASKTGLLGLTRTTALDLAPYNILVNALCPGFTLTELTKSILSSSEIKRLSKEVPLGRFAKSEEIARIAVFLCSDKNTYITGQTITADGGFTIR